MSNAICNENFIELAEIKLINDEHDGEQSNIYNNIFEFPNNIFNKILFKKCDLHYLNNTKWSKNYMIYYNDTYMFNCNLNTSDNKCAIASYLCSNEHGECAKKISFDISETHNFNNFMDNINILSIVLIHNYEYANTYMKIIKKYDMRTFNVIKNNTTYIISSTINCVYLFKLINFVPCFVESYDTIELLVSQNTHMLKSCRCFDSCCIA